MTEWLNLLGKVKVKVKFRVGLSQALIYNFINKNLKKKKQNTFESAHLNDM